LHQWSGSAHSVHQCFRGLGRTSVGPQALDGCSSNSSSAHTVALAADVADATACASLVACAEAIAEAVAWLEATASASRFCKWRTRRHVRQVACTTLQHSRRCVSSTAPLMQAGSGARPHPGVGDGQGAGDDGCVHGCLGGREAVGKGRGRVDRRGEGLADSCGVPSLLSHGPGLAGGGGVGAQAAASMVLCMGVGEDGVGQALSSPIWGSTQLIGG